MNEPLFPEKNSDPDNSTRKEWFSRGFGFWLFFSILVLVPLIYFFKHRNNKTVEEKKPVSVALAVVKNQTVPIYIPALGTVVATYTVTVKTQVNGLLMKVLYKEGQLVKQGDLLAEIDKRPLLAQLTQYQGQLVRDQALLANALIDLARYQRLWKQDSVSQQTLATQESLVRQYQGAVEIDQGLIESTKISLMYCNIISPINGRVGLRLVDPGNFVQTADTTGIVVITTLNPITVIFTIPEDEITAILPKAFADKNIKVYAYDRQQNKLLETGTLLTIDNQIDVTTGTVKLRAIFDNKENKLFANQFVNIQLLVNTLPNAITVATAAIQHGNQGDFVFVLKPDFTVSAQTIKAARSYGDETVVEEGLTIGQQVVVDGADKLVNGTKVRIAETKEFSQLTARQIRGNA